MKTYPIFAIIENKPCLVVGGGAVGERKVADLMAAGARVTVVSRTLTPELAALADRGEIRYLPEDFTEGPGGGHDPGHGRHGRPGGQRGRERRGPGPGHLGQRGRRARSIAPSLSRPRCAGAS